MREEVCHGELTDSRAQAKFKNSSKRHVRYTLQKRIPNESFLFFQKGEREKKHCRREERMRQNLSDILRGVNSSSIILAQKSMESNCQSRKRLRWVLAYDGDSIQTSEEKIPYRQQFSIYM